MTEATRHETFELDHFEKSVNNAAARVRGLWLGYIVLVAYLIITVGSVTHRDLFLENPVRLPVLNVDLSLKGFFFFAPLFFIINHFYLLLHLVGLRWRIREYDEAIGRALRFGKLKPSDEDTRRRGLDSFVIVQAFGGSQEERRGGTSWFLKLIIWITMIAAPIFVFLQMQWVFVAYHEETLTWVHRGAVVLDLFLLWLFWPMIHSGHPRLNLVHPFSGIFAFFAGLAFLLIAGLSVLVLTFPGETVDRAALMWISEEQKQRWAAKPFGKEWVTPPDPVLWRLKQNLPRNLDLPGVFLIDRDLYQKIVKRKPEGEQPHTGERTLVVSTISGKERRNLISSNLEGADLRGVELSGASLQGARLGGANLQGASLVDANLQGAWLDRASLQGASLDGASLQGASLDGASLQGASLNGARLQDAWLDHASLQGASLVGANLQGVSLFNANFQGARLGGANLQGASLRFARLQGAWLGDAKLQGAALGDAKLQGAWLGGANLQVASLNRARLQGAWLGDTSLQGASLYGSSLRQAELINTALWRAHGRIDGRPAHVGTIDFRPTAKGAYSSLRWFAVWGVASETVRKRILSRLSRLDPDSEPSDTEPLGLGAEQDAESVPPGDKKAGLYQILHEIGCFGEVRPQMAESMVHRLLNTVFREMVAVPLAEVFLAAAENTSGEAVEACPGAVGISEFAKKSLRKILGKAD